MGKRLMKRPCEDLLPGHVHCIHGHTEDCPDPGECEIIDADKDTSTDEDQ